MSQKIIISHIDSRTHFARLLDKNPGLIILKLGASWCRPCKIMAPTVEAFYASSPDDILCCDIDVDECHDLYSYFKSKKMVNGIPAMLCYTKQNTSYIPDESVTGAHPSELDIFFKRCASQYTRVKKSNIKPREESERFHLR